MSIQSGKAFVERMKNDEDFRKKVNECKDHDSRTAYVKKEGFDFTADELKKVAGELSEESLDAVVGGKWCDYVCNPGNSI